LIGHLLKGIPTSIIDRI